MQIIFLKILILGFFLKQAINSSANIAARCKPVQRDLTYVTIGDKVIAKQPDKKYYWGNIIDSFCRNLYSIQFENGTHFSHLLPIQIVSRNVVLYGSLQRNEKVLVKREDENIHHGILKGSKNVEFYSIEFNDGIIFH